MSENATMQSTRDADRLPFSGPLDADRFHCGPCQEEALARLHFLVEHDCRLGLVLGGNGFGKTWLLRTFRQALAGTGPEVALVPLAGVDADEFLWELAAQLGTGPSPGEPLGRLWRRVSDRLAENRWSGRAMVLLLDDATAASTQVLDHVRRLAELDAAGKTRLTMVLACEPAELEHVGPQLVALSALRVDLSPHVQRACRD
jgi:type II secretory pathway predicted ATPase ExeA